MAAWIVFAFFLMMIVFYLVKPNPRRMDAFPCLLFAHRGLHGRGVPENSLLAFRKTREKGVGVELDVRLTKDKNLVVFHDDNLKRMCGVDERISALSYESLKQYRLHDSNESIPLFADALDELGGVPVICEIKPDSGYPVLDICEAVCDKIQGYPGFVCVESFNPYVIQWFARNRPDIIRGQLSMNFMKYRHSLNFLHAFLMTHLLVNVFSRPDFIAYQFGDDSCGYFLCRKLFKPLLAAWTVKTGEQRKKAEMLFDGVIFEEEE